MYIGLYPQNDCFRGLSSAFPYCPIVDNSTMALNVLAVLLAVGQLGLCVPAPNDLGSDLTILVNNDLLGENPGINTYQWLF